jgi:hypothetical protein
MHKVDYSIFSFNRLNKVQLGWDILHMKKATTYGVPGLSSPIRIRQPFATPIVPPASKPFLPRTAHTILKNRRGREPNIELSLRTNVEPNGLQAVSWASQAGGATSFGRRLHPFGTHCVSTVNWMFALLIFAGRY